MAGRPFPWFASTRSGYAPAAIWQPSSIIYAAGNTTVLAPWALHDLPGRRVFADLQFSGGRACHRACVSS